MTIRPNAKNSGSIKFQKSASIAITSHEAAPLIHKYKRILVKSTRVEPACPKAAPFRAQGNNKTETILNRHVSMVLRLKLFDAGVTCYALRTGNLAIDKGLLAKA